MISGEKVRLRPIERDDLPRFVAWFSDPEVRRHLAVWLPFSLAQEERWFESRLEEIENQQEVLLAIETLEGVHIGNIGLHKVDWKNRQAELGVAIGKKAYWGQGYGTDAVRALLKLAFREMNMHRIMLRVDADNVQAIRCYEKTGFQKEGSLREAMFREGKYVNQHVMSILQSEFETNE
jgi:diamine N-acetyltransferase